jgi:acetyl esterase/lipase
MSPEAFFLIGALCAGPAFLATFRGRAPFAMAWFLAGWLTGEFALFHLAGQAVVVVIGVASGATDTPIGQVGLALMGLSAVGLVLAHHRARQAEPVVEAALVATLGADYRAAIGPVRAEALRRGVPRGLLVRPFRYEVPDVEVVRDRSYGPHGTLNTLDVYRRRDHPGRAPTLIHVHGGSWMHGRKERQAKPLTWHLAQQGWVVVSVNYRLSPKATFPDHVDDVKAAVAWVRDHAEELGADPDFIVLTGGSAGGHLAALAALDPSTGVQGCVPHYGIYDFLDRHRARGRHSLEGFLRKTIMKCSSVECRDAWDAASPIAQVGPHAPPFFVLHGAFYSMAYVTEARVFVQSLREASSQPVVYAELPAAQHAFDTFHTVRSTHVVNGVARWLAWLHATHQARPVRPAISGPVRPG